jgi:hypothetical protein
MTMNPATRRVNQRHDVQLPMEVISGDSSRPAVIQNISVGGLYFYCDFPVERQQLFTVAFSIPTLEVPIRVETVVRWTEKIGEATTGVGVQFLGLKAREVWAVTKFFTSLSTANL